jgi:hypothetical protein
MRIHIQAHDKSNTSTHRNRAGLVQPLFTSSVPQTPGELFASRRLIACRRSSQKATNELTVSENSPNVPEERG